MILLVNPQLKLLEMSRAMGNGNSGELSEEFSSPTMKTLPDPKMVEGKSAPETVYTSKTFGTGNTGSSQSRWIVTEAGKEQCVDLPDHECTAASPSDENTTNETVTIHLPAGQHLLMDIENVDESFLNSEEQLAHAMLELVNECGLTLLSYHCHKMIPMGVSCAGVLLESHVSFHTWPKEGVITLDLYTCGPNSLLSIVPMAEELFAVPREDEDAEEPNIVWAHKTRGYPQGDTGSIEAELSDMEYFPVGKMTDYKNEVASTETNFQTVRVYDVLIPGTQSVEAYKKSLSDDGSYESKNPELFAPDRIIYLDGVLQSRKTGEAAYHETLIHPAMFAHKNPKRVAIIGGGEGASLREVLKHKTVENVTMIEIDEMMVDVSRKYIPSWSDCSILEGSTPSCFDDPRVEVQYRDAFAWFIDNFPPDSPALAEPFDVIVMDALDPQIQKAFVNALYDSDGPFLKSIPKALDDDGVFIAQVGESSDGADPPEQVTDDSNRYRLVNSLPKLGFTTVRSYTDSAQSGFSFPWQFVAAFKNPDTKAEWFANPSLVNLKIRERAINTVDGGSPFKFFDGATMQSFYYPAKFIETVWCRSSPDSEYCNEGHGFDHDREDLPLDENASEGVLAGVDSYIGLKDKVSGAIHAEAQTYETFLKTSKLNDGKFWGVAIDSYIHGYGRIFPGVGRDTFVLDSTIRSMRNDACDERTSASTEYVAQENIDDPAPLYNPIADRQVRDYSKLRNDPSCRH